MLPVARVHTWRGRRPWSQQRMFVVAFVALCALGAWVAMRDRARDTDIGCGYGWRAPRPTISRACLDDPLAAGCF